MAQQPILIKANRLIRGPFGEIVDYWSKIQIYDVKKNASGRPWSALATDPSVVNVQAQITQVKNASFTSFQTNFQNAVDNVLKEEASTGTNLNIFLNAMPFGLDVSDVNKRLMNLNISDETGSMLEFIYLFKNLFPKEYEELDDSDNGRVALLRYAYGSLFDWPTINPKSTGIGSMSTFANMFKKHYFDPTSSTISVPDFLNDFKENFGLSYLYLSNNVTTAPPTGFDSNLNNFFNLNHNNWYDDTDVDKFIDASPNILADSYGMFFKRRGLLQNTGGGYGLYVLQQSNVTTGNYNLAGSSGGLNYEYIYNNDPSNALFKTSLFLFRRQYTGTPATISEIPKNVDTSDLMQGLKTDIMKYMYNYFTDGTASIGGSSPGNYPVVVGPIDPNTVTASIGNNPNTTAGFPNSYKYNENVKNESSTQITFTSQPMAGGSKKHHKKSHRKHRGGAIDDLLDDNHVLPALDVRRFPETFDKRNFANIIQQYKKDIVPMADPQKDDIFTKISGLSSIPMFFHAKTNDNRQYSDTSGANVQYNFEDLRKILLICNVFSNQFKLLGHFINNLIACYKSAKVKMGAVRDKLQKTLSSNELNNYGDLPVALDHMEYFDRMERNLTTLINNLGNIRKKVYEYTTDISLNGGTPNKDLFFGFLTSYFGTNIEFKEKLLKDIFVDENNGNLVLNSAVLSRVLRNISIDVTTTGNLQTNEYALGGLPFISIDPQINAKVWSTYWFSINWRTKANQYLSDNFNDFILDKLSQVTEKDFEKIQISLNTAFPQDKMRAIFSISDQQVKQREVIKNILDYFYKRSLNYAKFLIKQYNVFEEKSKNKKRSVKNIIRGALKNNSSLIDYKKNIYQALNLFGFEIDEMITKIRVTMFPDMASKANIQYQVQFRWICSRLKNLHTRLVYLIKAFNTSSSSNREKNLAKVGFNIQEVMSGTIENSPENKMGLIKYQIPDPNYLDKNWWRELYYRFNEFAGNKSGLADNTVRKLFVFGVNVIGGATAGVRTNVYLIDVFATAMQENDSIFNWSIWNPNIKEWSSTTDVNVKGAVKQVWNERNTVIDVTKFMSPNILQAILKKLPLTGTNNMFDIDKLIAGDLYAYSPVDDIFTQSATIKKLKPFFLQGKDDNTLLQIIAGNSPGSTPSSDVQQFKAYKIDGKTISNPSAMRKWCYDLLFSMPKTFDNPASDFDNIQVNFSKYGWVGGKNVFEYFMRQMIKSVMPIRAVGKINKSQILTSLRYGNLISQYGVQNMGLIEVGHED